jgi:hypothetical protein
MKRTSYLLVALMMMLLASCLKIDNNLPYISGVTVNGYAADTIYLVNGDLNVTYQISDDVMVVDSKVTMVQQDNLDSGFFYLSIVSVDANYFSGNDAIVVPDSVKEDSKLFKISVNAFDNSGNKAASVSKIINFK